MNTRIRPICFLILLAGLLPSCCKPTEIVEEDPFKVIALTPLKDNIPYQALGSGKIVFNRLHELNIDNCGFYIIDIDKKSATGKPVEPAYGSIYENDEYILPLSREELVNLVDATRESVSRILSEFHEEGLIDLNKKSIKILNRSKLLTIAEKG